MTSAGTARPAQAQRLHPSRAALVHDPARSVNPDKANGNLIIEGENLEVLKLLTSAYRERVKCIFIDPPYNTGNDFIYSDDYAEGQKPIGNKPVSLKMGSRLTQTPTATAFSFKLALNDAEPPSGCAVFNAARWSHICKY